MPCMHISVLLIQKHKVLLPFFFSIWGECTAQWIRNPLNKKKKPKTKPTKNKVPLARLPFDWTHITLHKLCLKNRKKNTKKRVPECCPYCLPHATESNTTEKMSKESITKNKSVSSDEHA